MKNLKVISAISLAMFANHAGADTYISEVALSYVDMKYANILGAKGMLYFDSVQTDGLPLAEAAFLNKASGVSLAHIRTQLDESFDDSDFNLTRLGLEYYVPNSIFYLGAGYSSVNSDFGSGNIWDVTIGITPVEGLLVSTTHEGGDVEDDGYVANLNLKYVTQLSGDTAFNVEAGYHDGGDFEDEITAAADYYLDSTFSVGVQVEDYVVTSYGLRTRKFFTPAFSVEASYMKADELDIYELGLAVRF